MVHPWLGGRYDNRVSAPGFCDLRELTMTTITGKSAAVSLGLALAICLLVSGCGQSAPVADGQIRAVVAAAPPPPPPAEAAEGESPRETPAAAGPSTGGSPPAAPTDAETAPAGEQPADDRPATGQPAVEDGGDAESLLVAAQAESKAAVGKHPFAQRIAIPEFSKNITWLNTTPLTKEDLKGKFVLLDFWASWCLPCRESNPHLIELYKRYHKAGFDVIAIAEDDDAVTSWKKAIQKDGTALWHNVLSGRKGNKSSPNSITYKFSIGALPTKILIDKNGTIIGRYTEADEKAMDEKLAAIFGK